MSIYGAGHVSTKEEKIQGRKAELPALCFLNLSTHFYVWVPAWVRRLTHILTHTVSGKKIRKIPEIIRFQGSSGAAGRIRTAGLILTKRLLMFFITISTCFICFFFEENAFQNFLKVQSPLFPHLSVVEMWSTSDLCKYCLHKF